MGRGGGKGSKETVGGRGSGRGGKGRRRKGKGKREEEEGEGGRILVLYTGVFNFNNNLLFNANALFTI